MAEPSRVLIVDDEPSVRAVLALIFEEEGCVVRTAENGSKALELLQGWQPDLILLDLMMPVMDGQTFRTEQRRRGAFADVPLVVLSAARDAAVQAEQLGAATVVHKPFEIAEMLEIVGRILKWQTT